jgi:hypothetical protein
MRPDAPIPTRLRPHGAPLPTLSFCEILIQLELELLVLRLKLSGIASCALCCGAVTTAQ